MCIIVYKPKGVKMDVETLKNCFDSNPHGAGIAWTNGGVLGYTKGLMTWDVFHTEFERLYAVDMDQVYHFRVSTCNGKLSQDTHPFLIGTKANPMYYKGTNTVLVHNGVLPKWGNAMYTDTHDFAQYLTEKNIDVNIELNGDLSYNKFAVVRVGGVDLHGKFIEDGGAFFSNNTYLTSEKYDYDYAYNGITGVTAEDFWDLWQELADLKVEVESLRKSMYWRE